MQGVRPLLAGTAAGGLLFAATMALEGAQFYRLADTFPAGEISTSASPASGGKTIYNKAWTGGSPSSNIYIELEAQADVHTGSGKPPNALLMRAFNDSGAGPVLCNPLAGSTGGVTPGWFTLLKLPLPSGSGDAGCNDGGGGAADCHDNAIVMKCCVPINGALSGTVRIDMASLNGTDSVFIEKVTVLALTDQNPENCTSTGAGFIRGPAAPNK